ncbi:MAG: hypothetical protein ABH843_02300 [Candidatus Omnitrophota bacterium]
MRPEIHAVVSFSLGVILWLLTKSVYAGFLCFIAGIVVDLDHIVEYIIHHSSRGFTIKKVCQACDQTNKQEGELKFPKLYLFFHSWELVIIFAIAVVYLRNIYLAAIAMGYASHLILDSTKNPAYPYSYFIIWRVIKKFHTHHLLRSKR